MNTKKGFTIIEFLIVTVVLLIVLGLVIPPIIEVTRRNIYKKIAMGRQLEDSEVRCMDEIKEWLDNKSGSERKVMDEKFGKLPENWYTDIAKSGRAEPVQEKKEIKGAEETERIKDLEAEIEKLKKQKQIARFKYEVRIVGPTYKKEYALFANGEEVMRDKEEKCRKILECLKVAQERGYKVKEGELK